MNSDAKIQLEQLGSAFGEALLSRTPGVGLMSDTFFRYRDRIKQERMYSHFEELKKDIDAMDPRGFNLEYLRSEEFSDFFESTLWRVINTASEEKVRRFKKILLNEMTHTYTSDFKETFLDIAFRINEDQILILKHFRKVKDYESEGNSEQRVVDGEGAETSLRCKANFLGFDEAKYLFYVQDLVSKSLLFDETIALFGGRTKPYTNLRITPFGEEFLRFIEGSPEQEGVSASLKSL